MAQPASPLFQIEPGLETRPLALDEAPRLQAFMAANPEYWLRVGDEPPGPQEAEEALRSRPPPELSWREHFNLGFWQNSATPRLQGFALVDSDLVLPGCWHIALFVIASELHGSGLATRWFEGLQAWARAGGAQWLRLGVVLGNTPAERFWARQGFVELRRREGIAAGRRVNTVRMMLKPLGEASVADYLARVPRDRPEPG